ncbi:tRNA (adenine(58)-N(1))-methyltransferase non-catalytic subunit trm6 [Ascosphaera atra]|nr:tRNA (adenine(58)-N(1))-methyltransferase non-catalytic subunit trm6 [Ascosphaera atra]
MQSTIQPYTYVSILLPSDTAKVQYIVPNTTVSLGKFGSFPSNQILGRPYYLTFEVLDQPADDAKDGKHVLRIVHAADLHMESLMLDGGAAPDELEDVAQALDEKDESSASTPAPVNQAKRDNRDILDSRTTQSLTMEEIEKLKKGATDAGQVIINQLMESHAALDQKTAFSLAKYKLRKQKKYLKRFSVHPLDVATLTQWMLEQKDPSRILELNGEMLGLVGCWGNVHSGGDPFGRRSMPSKPSGRWLIVDDTGGLMTAAMAERMGILYPEEATLDDTQAPEQSPSAPSTDESTQRKRTIIPGMTATNTTLTVIHPNAQPNLSMLKYFNFDITDPLETHPLHTNLKTISWLQLLDPSSDPLYSNEPLTVSDETLASWKPNKRGLYHRKHRRWQRVRSVVDETRAGGYDGLIIASVMDPVSILRHTVPLLTGSAHVVVYSPNIEPLTNLSDLYSTARRSAYLAWKRGEAPKNVNAEDFPLDPTLLFGPTIQTSRARAFQVLPGRTHPTMTARGGAVGYVFHATRGLRAEGRVTAPGQVARKKRKTGDETGQNTPKGEGSATPTVEGSREDM